MLDGIFPCGFSFLPHPPLLSDVDGNLEWKDAVDVVVVDVQREAARQRRRP